MDHMDCKPDLIIGNYSDGNLVASLMASKLGITQVTNSLSLATNAANPNGGPAILMFCCLLLNVGFLSTQGTIAHALEKTKYEDSDVKWKELDPKYHFSCQFTADLIAMNQTDFVITSTYQEIAGRLGFSILQS